MGDSAESVRAQNPEAPKVRPPRRRNRALIHAFVAVHLTAILGWSFTTPGGPSRLNRMVRSRVEPYVAWLRLGHAWNMFAPNPPFSNNRLEAEVTFADGRTETWRAPRVDQLGYFERYRGERHRKWATERVVAGGSPSPVVAEAAARFAARQVARGGDVPVKVELVRYRSQIPGPRPGRQKSYREPAGDWERQTLYSFEFDAAGHVTRRRPATQPGSGKGRSSATQPSDAPQQSPPEGTMDPGYLP